MKNSKKIFLLTAMVTLLLLCYAFGASALDTTGQCGDNVYWNYDETTGKLLISGEGDMTDYYEDDYMPWYDYRESIKSIEITNGVTSVGDYAFYKFENLESITIPSSAISIGDCAFALCTSLKDVTISRGMTHIGSWAFFDCSSLKCIVIPDSVTNIGQYAFHWTVYEYIVLPAGVAIGECAIHSKDVYYAGTKEQFESMIAASKPNLDIDGTVHYNFDYNGVESIESHFYLDIVEKPTCTTWGYGKDVCACGYIVSYNLYEYEPIGHNYTENIVAPTCTQSGHTEYTCLNCNDKYTRNHVSAIGHSYGDDNICDICGDDRSEDCSCNCHKTGLMSFIWKILRFFYKLFKINPVCECGIAHY